jgi:TPP-dependent pyruvate/acetoin dehydrogenase alpha subunit
MTPDKKTQLWMYETMVTSRYFEECLAVIYMEGKKPVFDLAKGPIPGEMHLSRGQEPVAVGVCAHLNRDDALTAGHRLHHFAIAKGVRLPAMTAEIFGKSSGLSGGRGGHMHIIDANCNFSASGIICEGMAPAAGAALAFKMRNEQRVGISVIGEGGANAGLFHETLNLAALWKLPYVCVIEDNSWAVSVAKATSTSVPRNDVRAAAYGIPGEYVAGNDPYEIYRVVGEAVKRARAGGGPTLIEVETWRYDGHFQGDTEHYLAKGEKEEKLARDPIPAMRAHMFKGHTASDADLDALEKKARAAVDEAIRFARVSPMAVPEDALSHVFA